MRWTKPQRLNKIIVKLIPLLFASPICAAEKIRVATSANFLPTLKTLSTLFFQKTGHEIVAISGSTGKLYAQITNGAPFHIFLAADEHSIHAIASKGLGDPDHIFTYAVGRLAIAYREKGPKITNIDEFINSEIFLKARYITIANPDSAPYGAAAKSVLKNLSLWDKIQKRLAFGENISQTLQMVHSGQSSVGFISWTQALALRDSEIKTFLIPSRWHTPLIQKAILLNHAKGSASARAFLLFLKTAEAKLIMKRAGYE